MQRDALPENTRAHGAALAYRREVDGLRALAVVPIILFHAGFTVFSGGYVGVDIFFVISGYLITSIILADVGKGRFSLKKFYERRARRILPALFVVVIACIPFAWLWMLPDEFEDFGKSVAYVAVFLSNILFHKQSGYFDTATELKPLLHTWSLAVEEQYYLLFPLFVLVVWKLGRRFLIPALAAIWLASLLYAHWLVFIKPENAYFLLPSRIWEILTGALIGAWTTMGYRSWTVGTAAGNVLAIVGLLMIAVAVFGFDQATPFPSLYAVVPCLGTALLLVFARPHNLVGRWLGTRLAVGIGLVSYSAYLWHQPLFAFARIRSVGSPGLALELALCMGTFLLAWLTWKYVETPLRQRTRLTPRAVFALGISGVAVLLLFASVSLSSGGFPSRLPEYVRLVYSSRPASGYCTISEKEVLAGVTCVIGAGKTPAHVAILGDSHAMHLSDALSDALKARGQSALIYSQQWCPPLVDVGTDMARKNPGCRAFMDAALATVANNPRVKTVVLAAEWSNYTTGSRWGDPGTALYSDRQTQKKSLDENVKVFQRGLDRTRGLLIGHGKSVIIVKSLPEYEYSVPKYLARLAMVQGATALPPERRVSQQQYRERNDAATHAFTRSGDAQWATIVDPYTLMCSTPYCQYLDSKGNVLYTDGNHLSYAGAELIVREIMRGMDSVPATPATQAAR